MITYSVLDIKENKTIGKGLSTNQVCKLIGMPNSQMVNNYANIGTHYKYRYAIQKDGEDMQIKTISQKITLELKKEWEEMRKAAELLKTGRGRIVTKRKGGKIFRYVEEIK
jgi:hypothetical protein